MSDNFGFIYDWMEDQPLPDEYTQYEGDAGKEDLLLKLYDEMTANMENPLDYDQWKQTYGKYIDEYNPAQEDLTQESFDIKFEQTEKLFDLKSDQEERDYDLIEKYTSVDDSDDFESSTELSIRHKKEIDKIDKRTNRLKLISEGVTLNQKKKIAGDETLLKNIRTGDTDRVVSELDKTFWNNMKVVRSEYDKQRVNRTQALDALILKADQTVESAFKAKEDSIESLFVSSEGKLKNAAVDLLGDKIALREDYTDEAWDTMGELAAGEAFIDTCSPVCENDQYCFRGNCYNDSNSLLQTISITEGTAGFEEIKNKYRNEDGTLPDLTCMMSEGGPTVENCLPADEYSQKQIEVVEDVLGELSDWSMYDIACAANGCPWGCGWSRGC
tara:strand:+ start:76 stop:1233 length:1158 start_codon:yes stop_codon:yes gene_type:complete